MSYLRMIWLALMVWAIQAHAQRRLVVVDVETLQPVVGANVIMISKLLNIKEVVVFGHGQRNELPEALKRQLEIDKKEAQLAAINPSSGNLLSLLSYIIPKKWRKSKKEKQRQRLKKILDEY